MTGTDEGILMYETSLGPDAQNRLKEIGSADLVIGIPSHRNGRTIGEVVQAISQAIALHMTHQRIVLMNADGGSSDNTSRHVAEAVVPANVEKLVTVYEGTTGRGTGIRAILEAVLQLNAKACLVMEARAPGIVPEWIPALMDPVLEGVDLAIASYQRSSYAAALGANLLHPFLLMFFNIDFREPLPSEFCVSASLAADLANQDVWETDVARFGFNIWMTLHSIAEQKRIVQVDLGYHGDPSGDPGAPSDARFLQTVGTLFSLLAVHRRLWQASGDTGAIPFYGARQPDRFVPCRECNVSLVGALVEGQQVYAEQWNKIFTPKTLQGIAKVCSKPCDGEEGFDFPVELWARLAIESAVVFNKGEGDPDKVIEALLPLFYGRAAAYMSQTRDLTCGEREVADREIIQAFVANRAYFYNLWSRYRPY